METTINLENPQNVWAWNGYNSQWTESFKDRQTVIEAALDTIERWGDDLESVDIIEDDDFITIVLKKDYWFYGRRWSVDVLTTRPGVFEPDEDDNLLGVWRPQ